MDVTQVLLVIVISVLTVLLVIIGIQVVYILGEIRKSLQKANKMLDDATVVTGSISKTVNSASSLAEGIKAGLSVVHMFGKKREE